jgi:ferredoxin-NADP reductase
MLTFKLNGEKYVRTWTISSCPRSVNWDITITVKRKEQGIISNWLFDNMRVGNKIKLLGVSGTFTLPEKSSKLFFIAGGVGITPLMSMIRYAVQQEEQFDIVLLHSVSNLKDRIFSQVCVSLGAGFYMR